MSRWPWGTWAPDKQQCVVSKPPRGQTQGAASRMSAWSGDVHTWTILEIIINLKLFMIFFFHHGRQNTRKNNQKYLYLKSIAKKKLVKLWFFKPLVLFLLDVSFHTTCKTYNISKVSDISQKGMVLCQNKRTNWYWLPMWNSQCFFINSRYG